MNPTPVFLFATLAMNQTRFFEAVGDALERGGRRVSYLCFHERSHDYLVSRNRRSFNAFREADGHDASIDLSRYPWPSLNLVLSHEKAAFEFYDTRRLTAKLRRYLAAAESAIETLQAASDARVTLVQELGGFLSNIAGFYAARRRSLHNVFIEPSFFRGRLFFALDTFAAPRVPGPRSAGVSEAVASYLAQAVARQQVVIPDKDVHHYRGPLKKLADRRNLRRLVEKSIDRYVLDKHEEFGHIGGHVLRHARMLVNHKLLAKHYRALPPAGAGFVYYPLHVPADVALTIRSPHYVDQCALIDVLARAVPDTHRVLIKEHPALIGAGDRRRILELLRTRDNVDLLDPHINNYEVLKRAAAVVTVNSKSGAEALLLGRPVLVLGDAFYSSCDLVYRVDSLAALPDALARILARGRDLERTSVERYFQDVWDGCWPGELHVADPGNARTVAQSLLQFIACAQ